MIRCTVVLALLVVLSGCLRSDAPEQKDSPHLITALPVIGLIIEPLLIDIDLDVLLKKGQSPHGYQIRPSEALFLNSATLMVTAHPDIDGWASELYPGPVLTLWSLPNTDPHFWTDPILVKEAIRKLSTKLCTTFPEKCISIRRRATYFSVRIDSVSLEIERRLKSSQSSCVVTAQPFMNHFLNRFSIPLVGPLQSQPGHDPSPASLAKMLDQAQRQGCRALLVQAAIDNRAFKVLANDLKIPIIEVDPLGTHASSYEGYLMDLSKVLEIAPR